MPKTYEQLLGFKEKKDLHPPEAPMVSETETGSAMAWKAVEVEGSSPLPRVLSKSDDSKLAIDWDRVQELSSFRRFCIDFLKMVDPMFAGISTRSKKEVMNEELNERISQVKAIGNIMRGSRLAMRECMIELQEVLKGRKIE